MRRPSPAAALASLALVPAALIALPASPATAAPGDSRATQLTRELQRDPVYISPSLSRVTTSEQVADLRRQVADMPFRTFVAIVPRYRDEPGSRLAGDLSTVLRDRIGEDGLYVLSDGSSTIEARAFGVRTQGEIRRVGSTVLDAVPTRDGPIARVSFALDHLATGRTSDRSVRSVGDANDRLPYLVMAGGAAVGLFVPLGVVAVLPGSPRRRAEDRARRAALKAAGPAPDPTISSPDAADAQREARDALLTLGKAIEAAPDPSDDVMRTFEAATTALGWDDARPVDHVGAMVLATRAQRALDGDIPAPCFFDPRHRDGDRASRWRRGKQDVVIPVCSTCARALSRDKTPVSLGDRGRPYWEQDTVWARTGFGAIDERVADAVLAGGPKR